MHARSITATILGLILPTFGGLIVDLDRRDDFIDVGFGLQVSNFSSLNVRTPELEARQKGYCTRPGGIQCPNIPTACCLPGEICQIATRKCCPSYGNQCGGLACCQPTAVCCPSVVTGCCAPGATCCGSTCCGPGVKCSGGVCQDRSTPTTSRLPTTSACLISGLKRQVGGGAACPTASGGATGTGTATGTGGPAVPTETRVPSVKPLVFDYEKLSKTPKPKYNQAQKDERQNALKELFTNMCLGMEGRGKLANQKEIFTFEEDELKKDANRKAAGCHGSPCASFVGQSCDEYPFASTNDGGANAIWNCIPEMAQDIQGGVISGWKRRNGVTSGTHFEFQIKGWDCKNPPKVRRASFDSPMTGVQDTFPPFDDEDVNNHAIFSLGDLTAGKYNVNAQANGTIIYAAVVDNEGEQFTGLNISQNAGQMSLEFTLNYHKLGVALILDTQNTEVDYSATLQNVTSTNAALALGPSIAMSWVGVGHLLCEVVAWGVLMMIS